MLHRHVAVVDVIQALHLVRLGRLEEPMFHTSGQALLRAATDVEPKRRVDPIHAFVISRSPGKSQPVACLPEADRRVLRDERVQRVDHRAVPFRLGSLPVRASRETHGPAALTDAHAVLLIHVRDQPALLTRA